MGVLSALYGTSLGLLFCHGVNHDKNHDQATLASACEFFILVAGNDEACNTNYVLQKLSFFQDNYTTRLNHT